MTTGDIIRNKRNDLGYEQQELAEKLGISKAQMCKIENGMVVPSLPVATAIARILGCTVNDLVG